MISTAGRARGAVAPKLLSSLACRLYSAAPSSTPVIPIIEFKEDKLHPHLSSTYVSNMSRTTSWQAEHVPQLRLATMPYAGGQLHTATRVYFYRGGYKERDESFRRLQLEPAWLNYGQRQQPCIQEQTSSIFVEAQLVKSMDAIHGLSLSSPSTLHTTEKSAGEVNCIYEIRRYKLILGYDTVPQFLSLYGQGLPSKLKAEGADPTTSLITLLYTEVGTLNEVIEVWRHGHGTEAMEKSRVAARSASEWRRTIAEIATLATEFTSSIHAPLDGSPMR